MGVMRVDLVRMFLVSFRLVVQTAMYPAGGVDQKVEVTKM